VLLRNYSLTHFHILGSQKVEDIRSSWWSLDCWCSKYVQHCCDAERTEIVSTVNLPNDATLGGADDGSGASPVGLQGHVLCCSGR